MNYKQYLAFQSNIRSWATERKMRVEDWDSKLFKLDKQIEIEEEK